MHEWILGAHRSDREAVGQALAERAEVRAIDCHRSHRGPYTGAGELLRSIAASATPRTQALLRRHALTLLSVAPDLAETFDVPEAVAKSFSFSREGNSRFWTLRIAHGLTDFLLEWAEGRDGAPVVYFENVHAADPTDQEFLSVLLARADVGALRVIVGTDDSELGVALAAALGARARVTRAPASPNASDDDASRLPFAAEGGARTLLAASAYCMRLAYYDACLDCSRRGLASLAVEPLDDEAVVRDLSRNALFSLLLLDRLDETAAFSEEIRRTSADPALLSHAAYAMAILYVRAYPVEKRDYALARRWVAEAHSFAERAPSSETRTVNLVFLQNTLALVEMRSGSPDLALGLLSDGLRRLELEAPGKPEESVILFYNRARLHAARGDLESAFLDYRAVVDREPGNSGAHLDRGILLQRLGRLEEALDAYDAAITWSPPYDEPHFNRAQILSELGRSEEAIAAYSRVLVLEPGHVNALVNRAGLFFESGRLERARADVERVLGHTPRNAKAWCLHGMLEAAAGRVDVALASFDRAIDCDPEEWTAHVNRATLLSRLV